MKSQNESDRKQKENQVKPLLIDLFIGTRPEAVKLAPLILQLKNRLEQVSGTLRVITTGQHQHLVIPILKAFEIHPDVELKVMVPSQTLSGLSSRILQTLEEFYLFNSHPDLILIQGDTTTCLMVGLFSFYNQIPLGHVEAGLRTFDPTQPFPEEINRTLIGKLAHLHFCPTPNNLENLVKEGVDTKGAFVTGNTGMDALESLKTRALPPPPFLFKCNPHQPIIAVTAHRRENHGKGIQNIAEALLDLSRDHQILLSLHPNPRVKETFLSILKGSSVIQFDPLDYLEFVALMKRSHLILTDSGGIQEEACALGKFVLVLRETTEREEGVDQGFLKLVGTDKKRITEEVRVFFKKFPLGKGYTPGKNPFGNGQASRQITQHIFHFFNLPNPYLGSE